MELTEIFFDTNFLRRKNIDDFSVFHFGNQVEDFIDFLGTNDVVDYYKINISEITTEELKKQINDKYKEELLKLNDSYNKFKNVHNIKFNVDENLQYDELLEKLMREYFEFYNINIVEIKNLSLQNLLKRAINKNKPFIGENGNSDKGFKDAVLWESIIEYAKKTKSKRFILFTKNVQDFPKELEDEFEKTTNKRIEIVNEISIIQEKILLEQSRNTNDILTLNWLKENVQILIEEINDYLSKHETWKSYQMLNISKIEDLVNKGNNFYSFMLFSNEDEKEWQWYVEVGFKNDEIHIDEVIPCL